MSDGTNIEWTDATWNPLRGCSRVSEGCRNCYAETVAGRFAGPGQPYEGLAKLDAKGNRRWSGEVRLIESALLQPLRWRRPRMIFVNSMSDLFHENVLDEWIDLIFAAMALAPQHIFQILTKRPQRMREYVLSRTKSLEVFTFKSPLADAARKISYAADHFFPGNAPLMFFSNRDEDGNVPQGCVATPGWPLSHVWLGVSVEDQKTADERIPLLLATPAAKRFISAEPLLSRLNLTSFGHEDDWMENALTGAKWHSRYGAKCVAQKLDWVICGGESGPNARPMHPEWARSLRDQCADAGVSFFFKQWGEWAPYKPIAGGDLGGDVRRGSVQAVSPLESGETMRVPGVCYMARVGKKVAGSTLDGREHKEFPA